MKRNISVIIPVYNAEKYIYNCIGSVLVQTYPDFEVIIIDDGSQDSSRNICEELGMIDKRIRFIHQEHGGVSSARNTGIEAAEGKYLFFLDSDDMIHPELLNSLYKLQEKYHTVIATAEFYRIEEDRFLKSMEWRTEDNYVDKIFYLGNREAEKPFFFTHKRIRLDAIGGKMILHDAVKMIRFDEKMTHGEDTLFLRQIVSDGADVIVLLQKWYCYRSNEKRKFKEYSVESYRVRYEVQKKLCDYEVNSGRISKAVNTEWRLLCEMILWYQMGRRSQDSEVVIYIKRKIEEERNLWIFSKMNWRRRLVFYLEYKSYLFHRLIAGSVHWYHHFTEPYHLKQPFRNR